MKDAALAAAGVTGCGFCGFAVKFTSLSPGTKKKYFPPGLRMEYNRVLIVFEQRRVAQTGKEHRRFYARVSHRPIVFTTSRVKAVAPQRANVRGA